MTVQQLHLFSDLGLALFIAVAVLTRATRRRVAGALAGAAIGKGASRPPSTARGKAAQAEESRLRMSHVSLSERAAGERVSKPDHPPAAGASAPRYSIQ